MFIWRTAHEDRIFNMNLWQNFLRASGVFLLYLIFAKIGLEYAVIGHTVTLLWPPSGIALAAVLIYGYRIWPGIALGALFANLGTDVPLETLLMISVGNTTEPLLGVFLLTFRHSFSIALNKISDVMALLVLATFGSTMIGASFGTLGMMIGNQIMSSNFGSTWLTWWLGDGMGILVISPVLLTGYVFARNKTLISYLTLPKFIEALILVTALFAVGQTIFGKDMTTGLGNFTISLAIFPFAIWSALRFGSFGSSVVALFASLLAINGTVNGTGPFIAHSSIDSLILWCLFADLIAVTGLILAAIDSQRRYAFIQLKRTNDNLEKQVQIRTDDLLQKKLELEQALIEHSQLNKEMNQISENRQKLIGQDLHDGLGQHLTGAAFLATSLHEMLASQSLPETPLALKVKLLLDEAMSMIRSFSRGLYPVALEEGGLSAALHHLVEYSENLSGIRCNVQCSVDQCLMDKDIELNLYRIAQEAVSNALRHSKAHQIDIKLTQSADRYTFSIQDDGKGLTNNQTQTSDSLGFRSIRSRAQLIGAQLHIKSGFPSGTAIIVIGNCKPTEN